MARSMVSASPHSCGAASMPPSTPPSSTGSTAWVEHPTDTSTMNGMADSIASSPAR